MSTDVMAVHQGRSVHPSAEPGLSWDPADLSLRRGTSVRQGEPGLQRTKRLAPRSRCSMANRDVMEKRIQLLEQQLVREFGNDAGARWELARALIHRAVHVATDKPAVDFCAVATYLAEMVQHAHKLAHGENPQSPSHGQHTH
jgi:hypothetical protein